MDAAARSPSPAAGVLTVVLTLTGWSSIPLFLRYFADAIDLWTSNGWRYGFSALVWAPVLVVAATHGRLPRGLWRAAVVPSVVNATGQVCFTAAHYVIDPALLTFGLRCQLFFVAVGAWLLFPKERAIIRTPGYLLGAALLIVGMVGVLALDHQQAAAPPVAAASDVRGGAVTMRDDGERDSNMLKDVGTSAADHAMLRGSSRAHVIGVVLALASGFLFACYGLSVRKYMEGVNPVLAFAAICQYTAAALVILMVILGDRAGLSALDLSGQQMLWLLVSALIGIAIGHVFYYISIARLGVAVTAGVLQLQPFIVAIGSMIGFDERLSVWQWIGGFIAVSGAMLMLYMQWLMSRRVPRLEEPLAIAEGESGA